MSFRYQASSVSGFATAANSSKPFNALEIFDHTGSASLMTDSFIRLSVIAGPFRWRFFGRCARICIHGHLKRVSGKTYSEHQTSDWRVGRFAPRRSIQAVQHLWQPQLPLQSHSPDQAWPLLSDQLYPAR